jgi:hypothetical protein
MAEFHRMEAIVNPLQNIAKSQLAPAFTTANARAMAARSAEARRLKRMKRENQRTEAALPNAICAQAARLWEAMENIASKMATCRSAELLVDLASAHTKIRTDWQVLTGTPNPGSRRVKASRPSLASVETVQVVSDNNQI